MTDRAVVVANVACWGVVLLVWFVGFLYNALHPSTERIRGQSGSMELAGAAVLASAIVVILGREWAQNFAVEAAWVRVLGLGVLVLSTAFALWARFSLGRLWSIGPRVGKDRRLRTRGPYEVTRHPIYTGLLGMLLGTTLLAGIGQWIVLVPVGLIGFAVKIRAEEHLLLVIFPDEYPRYRERVPQLVPGLHVLRHLRIHA
jgi:protein-S-isoprenylcysteine O-methyltransferase Ste14